MAVKKKKENIEIARFCSKKFTNVQGAFPRLLKYVIDGYKPNKVYSFCDLRYATGASYVNSGFKIQSEHVSFKWCDTHGNTYSRFFCRASATQTEKEIAKEKKLVKIWDAGQRLYVLEVKHEKN